METTSKSGFSIQRGASGAGTAAAVGIAIVLPLGFLGFGLCFLLVTSLACAGWATHAPDGKHRFVGDLLTMYVLTFIAADAAAVSMIGSPWVSMLGVPLMAQVIAAAVLTDCRARRALEKAATGQTSPISTPA